MRQSAATEIKRSLRRRRQSPYWWSNANNRKDEWRRHACEPTRKTFIETATSFTQKQAGTRMRAFYKWTKEYDFCFHSGET